MVLSFTQALQHLLIAFAVVDSSSGILLMLIHEADELEYPETKLSRDNPTFAVTDKFPNAYVEVLINQEIVYRTRTKLSNPMPYWNAYFEKFIRNYDTLTVDFQLKDQQSLKSDPLFGSLSLKLPSRDQQSVSSSGWHHLSPGTGSGRLHVSIAFKPLKLNIPKNLLGWSMFITYQLDCFR